MTPPKQIWPSIRYEDAPGAIRFLVDVCGFEERLVVKGEGDREIAHAQLAWPEGGALSVLEAARNVACAGGEPLAVTD